MLRAFRDFLSLTRASGKLGRASKLRKRGKFDAAKQAYAEVIRRLDAVGTLPASAANFSIRDIVHVSIRIVACAEYAELLDRAGDHDRAGQLGQQVLDICIRAPRNPKNSDLMSKWEKWARAFIATQHPTA
jgi:hypothetical protein